MPVRECILLNASHFVLKIFARREPESNLSTRLADATALTLQAWLFFHLGIASKGEDFQTVWLKYALPPSTNQPRETTTHCEAHRL
jgi:hypothetical protein